MSEPTWIPLGGSQGAVGPQGPQGATGPMGPSGAAVWATGDIKFGMQPASHADPGGGMWLLMDGTAIPAQYTALIAMAGPNLPDARGRGVVAKGTHADVDTIGDNDGVALASRSPRHKSSVSDPGHSHSLKNGSLYTTDNFNEIATQRVNRTDTATTNPAATGITVGPAASAMIDTGSFVVIGNVFVHT